MHADITRNDDSLPHRIFPDAASFSSSTRFLPLRPSSFFSSLPRVPFESSLSLSGVWCYYQTPRRAVRWNRAKSIDPNRRRLAWFNVGRAIQRIERFTSVRFYLPTFCIFGLRPVGWLEFSAREIPGCSGPQTGNFRITWVPSNARTSEFRIRMYQASNKFSASTYYTQSRNISLNLNISPSS